MEAEIVDADDETVATFFGWVLSVCIGVDDLRRGLRPSAAPANCPLHSALGLTQLCQRNHNARAVHWTECARSALDRVRTCRAFILIRPNMFAFCRNRRSRELISWSMDAIASVFVSCSSAIFHYQEIGSQPIIMSLVWSRVADIWRTDERDRVLFYLLFLHFPKFRLHLPNYLDILHRY